MCLIHKDLISLYTMNIAPSTSVGLINTETESVYLLFFSYIFIYARQYSTMVKLLTI